MSDYEKFLLAMKTINRIGDYFEYSNESQKDKDVVMANIDQLTESLKEGIRKNTKKA